MSESALTPPEPGMVLRVCRWSEVFETAKSRGYANLPWISVPTGFNSTGLQCLLDSFDPREAAALYGAWVALLKVAATAPVRGVLAGRNGEQYTSRRIARLSGFMDAGLFDELIRWALNGNEAGCFAWLEWVALDEAKPDQVPDESPTGPQQDPVGSATERNGTEHDITKTERDGTERDKPPATVPGRSVPVEVSFSDRIKGSSLLEELAAKPVEKHPAGFRGGVFADLTPADLARPPAFWVKWYRRQLSSPSPVLTGANHAELSMVIAMAATMRDLPDSAVKRNRLAMWIVRIRDQNATDISAPKLQEAVAYLSEPDRAGDMQPQSNRPTPHRSLGDEFRRKRGQATA